MPEISIIIPVYNAEKYIKRAVESVIKQDVNEMEIILVNDGSTDQSLLLMEELAKMDKRIKVFNQENRGVSSARNTGIKNATGNYIMFIDADDILLQDAIKTLLYNAKEKKVDISIGDIEIGKEKRREIRKKEKSKVKCISKGEMIKSFFLDNALFNCYSACGKIYSKEIYKKLKFFENRNSNEDRFYFFQALCLCKDVVYENRTVYLYEKHKNSLSNAKVDNRILDNMYFSDKMLEYVQKNDKEKARYAKYNQLLTYMMVYRNFYRDKNAIKTYKIELKDIRKSILEFKNIEIGISKKVEIFVIKFMNPLYYYMLRIYDIFKLLI